MARHRQSDGEKYIEADNGIGWTRQKASVASVLSGNYEAYLFGIRYELEKRRRSVREPGADTGWYLYSHGDTYFFGEFCDRTLLSAIDEASKLITAADLRGEGYERKGNA